VSQRAFRGSSRALATASSLYREPSSMYGRMRTIQLYWVIVQSRSAPLPWPIRCSKRFSRPPAITGDVRAFFIARCGARHYLHFGGIIRLSRKASDRHKLLDALGLDSWIMDAMAPIYSFSHVSRCAVQKSVKSGGPPAYCFGTDCMVRVTQEWLKQKPSGMGNGSSANYWRIAERKTHGG
jgi:hypothetical protein